MREQEVEEQLGVILWPWERFKEELKRSKDGFLQSEPPFWIETGSIHTALRDLYNRTDLDLERVEYGRFVGVEEWGSALWFSNIQRGSRDKVVVSTKLFSQHAFERLRGVVVAMHSHNSDRAHSLMDVYPLSQPGTYVCSAVATQNYNYMILRSRDSLRENSTMIDSGNSETDVDRWVNIQYARNVTNQELRFDTIAHFLISLRRAVEERDRSILHDTVQYYGWHIYVGRAEKPLVERWDLDRRIP